jgi:hypothetical protein
MSPTDRGNDLLHAAFVLILILILLRRLRRAKHSASPGWNCLQTTDFAIPVTSGFMLALRSARAAFDSMAITTLPIQIRMICARRDAVAQTP